ncbi:hypothetical protein KZZ19_028670 (plasmid) [Bacillus thuringiensis]|nr:hypothetical protein [Bacillus thuringiensis]
MTDKIASLKAQTNSIEKLIKQRKETLEYERKKVDVTKKGKEEKKKNALNRYKEDAVISINQRIQSLEQEVFINKQMKTLPL